MTEILRKDGTSNTNMRNITKVDNVIKNVKITEKNKLIERQKNSQTEDVNIEEEQTNLIV